MQAISFLGFTGSSTATIGWDMFCMESKVTKKDRNILKGQAIQKNGRTIRGYNRFMQPSAIMQEPFSPSYLKLPTEHLRPIGSLVQGFWVVSSQ
jgi:hypothetical protein